MAKPTVVNEANQAVKHYLEQIHTMPFESSSRRKPRRWPLVLRFIKGAIHYDIAIPVVVHTLFAALVVVLNRFVSQHIVLPSSIVRTLRLVHKGLQY